MTEFMRSRRTPPGLDFRGDPEVVRRLSFQAPPSVLLQARPPVLRDDDYIFYANDVGVLTIPTEAEVSKYGSRVDDSVPSPLPVCRTCGVAFRSLPDSDGQCDTCVARSKTLITGGKPVTPARSTFKVKGRKAASDLNALMKEIYSQPILDDLGRRLRGAADAEIWDADGRVEIERDYIPVQERRTLSARETLERFEDVNRVTRPPQTRVEKPKFEEKPKGRRINLDGDE